MDDKMNNLRKKNVIREEAIRVICDETGWSVEEAELALEHARKLGLNARPYVRYKGWTLNDEGIVKLVEKLERQRKLREEKVDFVCQATGWDRETAIKEMNQANKLGITYAQYAARWMFTLSDIEMQEFAGLLKLKKQNEQENQNFYVNCVAKWSGWNKELVSEKMKAAAKRGISFFKYAQKGCWTYNEEQMTSLVETLKTDKKRVRENKERYLKGIMDATNWTRGKAELEVLKSNVVTRCSYEDFLVFRFWERSLAEQQQFVTLELFNKVRLLQNDSKKVSEIMDDKAAFNNCFREFVHRKWFLNVDMSYELFLDNISNLDAIIVKPINAAQGKGIVKYDCNVPEDDKRTIYEAIMRQGTCIIEEYIVQHDAVMAFCETSVNTLRITTMNENGKCKYLYAGFRMGCGGVVDNFHSGGIRCAVDPKTGITITHAVDMEGNTYEIHPYSGLKTKDFQIPHWDRIIDACENIYNRVEGINLVGWDFAITPDGVDLIEGNPGASYIGAQISHNNERIGLRALMVGDYLQDVSN